jgi:hypothetical protein
MMDFLDEYGLACVKRTAHLPSGKRTELVNALADRYSKTKDRADLETLWDHLHGYVASLPRRDKGLLFGFEREECISEAFFCLEKAATSYQIKYGVPFVLYFRMKFRARMQQLREAEGRYFAVDMQEMEDAPYSNEDELLTSEEVTDAGARLTKLLSAMEPSHEVSVAKAYVECWVESKTPRGALLSARSGLTLKEVSATMQDLPNVVRSLIL